MSYIMELRILSKYNDIFGLKHADVFWNYASHTTDDEKIREMREKSREMSKKANKGTISFERMTRTTDGKGYYWRVLNEFSDGNDITD